MTPILKNIAIKTNGDIVTFLGTNLESTIYYSCECEVIEEWDFTIDSKFLNDFCSIVTDDTVTISTQQKTGAISNSWATYTDHLTLKTKSSTVKYKWTRYDKFPVIELPKWWETFSVWGDILISSFKKTLFSTADANIRPTLAGVLVSWDGSNICFASTDSFRLSEVTLQSDIVIKQVIIPDSLIKIILHLVKVEDKVNVTVSDTWISCEVNDIKIFWRVIRGAFPNYKGFFPNNMNNSIEFHRKELIQHLKWVILVANQNNNRVTFRSTSNGVTITSGDTEIGKVEYIVEWGSIAEPLTLNWRFLIENLVVMNSDKIKFQWEKTNSPVIIVPSDEALWTERYLIMPIKA